MGIVDPAVELRSFLLLDPEDRVPAKFLHGSLAATTPILKAFNERLGMGVFETVNRTNGLSREQAAITHLRAFYADFDDGVPALKDLPLQPTRILSSSPEKAQFFWVLAEPVKQTDETARTYLGIQHSLVKTLGGDLNARDIPRVLRVPGFYNTKYPSRPLVKTLQDNGPHYTFQQVKDAYGMIEQPIMYKGSERTAPADDERAVQALYNAMRRNPPPTEPHTWDNWLYRLCSWGVGNLGISPSRLEEELHMHLQDFDGELITRTVRNADRYAKRLKPAPLEIEV